MKTILVCILVLFVVLIDTSPASQVMLSQPIGVDVKYEGEVSISAKKELQKLTHLVVSIKGIPVSIPVAELEDLVNPELDLIELQISPKDGPEHSEMWITLKFNRRFYEWGDGLSSVTFEFVGGKYIERVVSRPTAKNEWFSRTKKVGQPEDE